MDALVADMQSVTPARRKPTRAERISQLRERAARLERHEKAEQRKLDTRRKIVVGGMVLAAIEHDPVFAATIKTLLQQLVTRENDRKVIADLF